MSLIKSQSSFFKLKKKSIKNPALCSFLDWNKNKKRIRLFSAKSISTSMQTNETKTKSVENNDNEINTKHIFKSKLGSYINDNITSIINQNKSNEECNILHLKGIFNNKINNINQLDSTSNITLYKNRRNTSNRHIFESSEGNIGAYSNKIIEECKRNNPKLLNNSTINFMCNTKNKLLNNNNLLEKLIQINELKKKKRNDLFKLKYSVFLDCNNSISSNNCNSNLINEKVKKEENKIVKDRVDSELVKRENAELQKQLKQHIKEEEKIKSEYLLLNKQMEIYKIKENLFFDLYDEMLSVKEKGRKEFSLEMDKINIRVISTKKYYERVLENIKNKEIDKTNIENKSNLLFKQKNEVDQYADEYNKIMKEIEEEQNYVSSKYKKFLNEIEPLIKETQLKLKEIKSEFKKIKEIHNKYREDQINYYKKLLKNGEQTRKKGLLWIVIRLIELGCEINKYIFPTFLNDEQINYIIEMSLKEYQFNIYKNNLNSININKEKQKNLSLKEIQKNCNDLNNIVQTLKERLKLYALSNDENLLTGTFIKKSDYFLNKNETQKQYILNISELNNKMTNLRKNIFYLKKRTIEKFLSKNKVVEIKNEAILSHLKSVFSAMFGEDPLIVRLFSKKL